MEFVVWLLRIPTLNLPSSGFRCSDDRSCVPNCSVLAFFRDPSCTFSPTEPDKIDCGRKPFIAEFKHYDQTRKFSTESLNKKHRGKGWYGYQHYVDAAFSNYATGRPSEN